VASLNVIYKFGLRPLTHRHGILVNLILKLYSKFLCQPPHLELIRAKKLILFQIICVIHVYPYKYILLPRISVTHFQKILKEMLTKF
jgi:hypothetical protein